VEAEVSADALHGVVIEKDVGGYAPEALGAAYLEELAQEKGADALALEAVSGFVRSATRAISRS
jgi:hypothetical protein